MVRVYFQYTTDNVKETFYDATIGCQWNLRGDGSVINAKINTPIAVLSWASGIQVRGAFDDAGKRRLKLCDAQIRVYYLDKDNFISERAF
jgi:hypothetical protein